MWVTHTAALAGARLPPSPAKLPRTRNQHLSAASHLIQVNPLDHGVCTFSAGTENDRWNTGSAQNRRVHPRRRPHNRGLTTQQRGRLAPHNLDDGFILGHLESISYQRGSERCLEGWINCHHPVENFSYLRLDTLLRLAGYCPTLYAQNAAFGIT